jgi:hypothetical protein
MCLSLATCDAPRDDLDAGRKCLPQQLADFAGLLNESHERAKAEFQRLNLAITLHVVRSKGGAFYRPDAPADLLWLAGKRDFAGSAAGLSDRESTGRSRWGFGVDLPKNSPVRLGSRRRVE